jgi:adenylate cyclase
MGEQPVERRLAAILVADVAGYSRLMGADEVGTFRSLQAHLREVIDPTIAARGGRIVKTAGDGLLVEFPSAVEAVACAIAIQQALLLRNVAVPPGERLMFRIGINVGDVIVKGTDIFGDGVNVAARLESICEPGGLCISRSVRDQVRDRLPVTFNDLGEHAVKNIARKVRVFALEADAIAAASLPKADVASVHKRPLRWIPVVVVVFGSVTAGVGAWWELRHVAGPAAEAPAASPANSRVIQQASIAVLPFVSLANQSSEGDYFADGLTEDIISALGRFSELSVISRAGVFAYKGKNPAPAEVHRDLDVRYVVEGSVRRSTERVRVSVSLTDTTRAALLWSNRYDVQMKDIFSVQEQIAREISGALAVKVTHLEIAQSAAKPPDSMEAYDLVLRGRASLARAKRSDNAEARTLFERAIQLDPNYAPAYVGLGRVNLRAVQQGWTASPSETLQRAENLARKAMELDDSSAGAHALLGTVYVHFGNYDRGLVELRRAIDLNGSDAESYSGLLDALLWSGDTAGAIAAGDLLSKFQPDLTATESFHLATALVLAKRSNDAARLLEEAIDSSRANLYTYVMLAVAYADIGRRDEAIRMSNAVRARFPNFSREEFGSLLRDKAQRDKLDLLLDKAKL